MASFWTSFLGVWKQENAGLRADYYYIFPGTKAPQGTEAWMVRSFWLKSVFKGPDAEIILLTCLTTEKREARVNKWEEEGEEVLGQEPGSYFR